MVSPSPTQRLGAVARLIALCAANRGITLLLVAAAALWGGYALREAKLDAIPDLSDVQVIVYAEWPGRSPDLVEAQVTYPISTQLLAAPGKLESLRPRVAAFAGERWSWEKCVARYAALLRACATRQ